MSENSIFCNKVSSVKEILNNHLLRLFVWFLRKLNEENKKVAGIADSLYVLEYNNEMFEIFSLRNRPKHIILRKLQNPDGNFTYYDCDEDTQNEVIKFLKSKSSDSK